MLTSSPRVRAAGAGLLVLATAASCGRLANAHVAASASPQPSFEIQDAPARDWHHPSEEAPIGPADLSGYAFRVYVPSALGTVSAFATPSDLDPSDQAVTMVVDTAQNGVVWLIEKLPDIADAADRESWYQQVVAENGQPNRNVMASIVTLPSGVNALLGIGTGGDALIRWSEGGVEYELLGQVLTGDEAVAIASQVDQALNV